MGQKAVQTDLSNIYMYIYYLFTYLLTALRTVLLEKLTAFQLVKKFLAFYGTRLFITACTSAHYLSLILSQLDPFHTPTFNILKIHLNIILPFAPGSPKWPVSFTFLHPNPVHASPLHYTRYMTRPSHSSRLYHRTI